MRNYAAGWHIVEGDEERARYWDGTQWTEQYKSAAIYYAERQDRLLRRIAGDVRSTRGWVTFMGVLTLIGLIFGNSRLGSQRSA